MKDLYQELLKYYRFMIGKIPKEDIFLKAVQETVTPEDLRIFFLLPFTGYIMEEKLLPKVKRANIPLDEFQQRCDYMVRQGVILRYTKPEGRAYERGNIAYMSEQQVRMHEESPRRSAYAEFMDALIEGETGSVPNRTPYYRVLPVESSITIGSQADELEINLPVADPRGVLPFDIISDMVKAEPLVGVAACYCRSARQIVGKDCGHPLETCFVFNELAETLIDAGLARQLDHEEALQILHNCEQAGLIHFVDNAEGQIKSLCNCCPCSCVIFSVIRRGGTNAGGPSRFIISYNGERCTQCGTCAEICPTDALSYDGKLHVDDAKCIGCGLCVSRCPEGALQLVPREKVPRTFPSNEKLWAHIARESVVGMAVNRLLKK